MATLCVYLPKYSITLCGPPKGALAYTTHSFLYSILNSADVSVSAVGITVLLAINPFNACRNFVLYTTLIAFKGNRKRYIFFLASFQLLSLVIPPPLTIQWMCG